MTDINGDNSIELDVPKDSEKNKRKEVKIGVNSNNVVLEQKHPLISPTASVSTTNTNTNNVIQRTRVEEATTANEVDNNNKDNDNNDSNNNGANNTNEQQQQQRQQRSNTSPENSSEGQYDFSIPSSSNARNNKDNNNNNANVDVANNGSQSQQQQQQQLAVEQQNDTQAQQRLIPPSSLHDSATVNNNNIQADVQIVKQNIENLRQEKFKCLFTTAEKDPEKIVAAFKTAIEEFPEIFEQTTDEYGRSALHLAILSKNYKLVQWLVDEGGARENAVDIENQSIAHYAAYVGDAEILTYLIDDARCSINMKDKTGRSLISHAAMRNNWRIIDLLVSKYKMDIDSTDHFGTNALHWAAAKGAKEAGLCLVQKGINIHLKVLDQSAKQIIEKQKETNENNSIFYTFLNLHEKIGNEFLSLVSKKATTINNLKDKMTEWDKFSNEYSKINSLKAEKVKIQYVRNRLGQTALHIAAHKQNIDIVKFLVENQFYITAEDYLKRLPVHYAALYGKQDIATYLINMPASEDEKQIRRRRDGGEDDEGAVQVVKHWKKKTKTGLTPDKMAGKGYEAKTHSNEKLQELLLNFAQVRGQPTQQQHQQPLGNIRGTDVPHRGSEKSLEEAIENDKTLAEGPVVASGSIEELVGKGASIVLDRCKLPQYVERFNEDGFDTIESLKNLNESDLKDMGVKKGHIRVIMNYLHEEYVS
jgi:ankyrin repeat protein